MHLIFCPLPKSTFFVSFAGMKKSLDFDWTNYLIGFFTFFFFLFYWSASRIEVLESKESKTKIEEKKKFLFFCVSWEWVFLSDDYYFAMFLQFLFNQNQCKRNNKRRKENAHTKERRKKIVAMKVTLKNMLPFTIFSLSITVFGVVHSDTMFFSACARQKKHITILLAANTQAKRTHKVYKS